MCNRINYRSKRIICSTKSTNNTPETIGFMPEINLPKIFVVFFRIGSTFPMARWKLNFIVFASHAVRQPPQCAAHTHTRDSNRFWIVHIVVVVALNSRKQQLWKYFEKHAERLKLLINRSDSHCDVRIEMFIFISCETVPFGFGLVTIVDGDGIYMWCDDKPFFNTIFTVGFILQHLRHFHLLCRLTDWAQATASDTNHMF